LCCSRAGQLITIPGTPQRLLYFVARGYADLYMADTLIDTLVAGDTFGEAVRQQLLALQPLLKLAHMPCWMVCYLLI
jgi:hypothetical protein